MISRFTSTVLALVALLSIVPIAFATTMAPPGGGSWTINYFTATSFACTGIGSNTVWPTTGFDGAAGYADSNVGGPSPHNTVPVVDAGQSICIQLVLSGYTGGCGACVPTTGGTIYFKVDATLPLGSFVLTSGSGSGSIVWTNSVAGSGVSVCTIPVKATTEGNTATGFDGHEPDHLLLGTATGGLCTIGVPEFGALAMIPAALVFPLLVWFKRRSLAIRSL